MITECVTPTEENLRRAGEILKNGGLVAFPTETVYGLGGNGLNAEASKKIYEAKGRPSDNPLILHIGKKEQLYPLVREVSEKAEKLMDHFWPGPLTLIFKKASCVPETTSGGLDTVAVRFPSHLIANALLKAMDFPVAAPSANLSGRPSTTRASHVIADLNGRVAAIIDGGDVPIGVESTILDMTQDPPVLLRPGYISLEALKEAIGEVLVDPAIGKDAIISHSKEVEHPKAPGMKYRHYAPKAPLTIVCGEPEKVVKAMASAADKTTGILTTDEHLSCYKTGIVFSVGSLKEPDQILHNLFDVLRRFDEEEVYRIYAEDLSEADTTGALMNRLLKSAGGSYIPYSEL